MISILIGFILDLIIGEPQNPLHPVRVIGFLCSKLEKLFRKLFKDKLRLAGFFTWTTVIAISYFITLAIVKIAYSINNILGIIICGIIIYFCISVKGLKVEGLKVVKFLLEDNIIAARKQLSYIVGRDTNNLDKSSILRAVIETIAENMSDGIIAPLLFIGIGGAPLGVLYKAVNTMDSMFGYKNEMYMEFGYFPAKLDDVFNYIPARITGYLSIVAAFILKLDYKNSFKIYRRDKNNHSSPNSAHPEAAVAGALNIKLGGPNYYFGKLVNKPTIGDDNENESIEKVYSVNSILYLVGIMGLIISCLLNYVINILIF